MRWIIRLLPGAQVALRVPAIVERNHQIVIVVDVARSAGHVGVSVRQRKPRRVVVELCVEPAVKRNMASLATRRELGSHVIGIRCFLKIRHVAGLTGCRETHVLTSGGVLVALLAFHDGVRAEQREAVEVIVDGLHGHVPAIDRVALGAVGSVLAAVNVGVTISAVFADVGENRFYVAAYAGNFFVHAAQRIPGPVVIEFRVRLDRAPRGHSVAIFARDVERRPVRIARSRSVLLMGRLASLASLRTRWRRASHTGEGQQSPQSELEHCQRKGTPSEAGSNTPAGKGPMKLPALCADSRGEATVRGTSYGAVRQFLQTKA